MTVDDELLEAFLEESDENLNQLDLDLVALEASPQDPEILARIFRTIHTIKGTCGFLGFGNLEHLAHAGEDLLSGLRSGQIVLDEAITTSLLSLVDEVRGVLAIVAATGTEGDNDHAAVVAELRGHLTDRPGSDDGADGAAAGGGTVPKAADAATGGAGPAAQREESTVRIDVSVLDSLQDLVGELTLARMRLGDFVPDDGPLAHSYQRLTGITRNLQDAVMRARLQPIATATDRLRRIVRDVAANQHKQVHLVIEGDDVTVDKAINEILRDPLVHLVRNAVDHGMESPTERLAAGKPEVATLTVRASLIGGGVHIDVADDGRGINVQRLVERAIEAGRITAAEAASLPEAQRTALLFQPGVSTAEQITTVSGRGVGMDVVRSTLEQVGGSIEVSSEPGRGTSFRINVPLTLAILPAITVECGTSRFVIPQTDVLAVVRIATSDISTRVRTIGESRFLRYQGALLPLIDVADYLNLEASQQARADHLEVVVIRKLERGYGLVVDHVGDDIDAVVKPLPRAIRGMAHYAGTTVLADGHPALILETAAPAVAADLQPIATDREAAEAAGTSAVGSDLVITVSVAGERFALPLSRVRRLERIDGSAIQRSGHGEVVLYQDTVLSIADLGALLGLRATGAAQAGPMCSLVVMRGQHQDIGLLVDSVGDIQTAPLGDAEVVSAQGVAGRIVLNGRVVQLLDVDWAATRATATPAPGTEAADGR